MDVFPICSSSVFNLKCSFPVVQRESTPDKQRQSMLSFPLIILKSLGPSMECFTVQSLTELFNNKNYLKVYASPHPTVVMVTIAHHKPS